MPDRKRKTKNPCAGCFLHVDRCICSQIPRLTLRTHLTLIIHAKEMKRTTNSGQLALRALSDSDMVVRGLGVVDLRECLKPGYRPLLLYPGPGARPLDTALVAESKLPVQLLVPDGNWRQASKVGTRHPEIDFVERVMLPVKNEATEHLRAESSEYGMSTLQAIALAMTAIGEEAGGRALETLYREKLRATLAGRPG